MSSRLLLACTALSILTLPLALVQKISLAGAEFSASYLFIGLIFVWTILRAVTRLPVRFPAVPHASTVVPFLLLGLCLFYTLIDGFDASFMTAIGFWVMFTFLGMQIDDELAVRIVKQLSKLAVCTSCIGLALYAINIPLIDLKLSGGDQYFVDTWGHYRASSIFLNPNSFGYFLVFFLATQLFTPGHPGTRGWLGIGIVLAALFLSGSRSAWLASLYLLATRAILGLHPRMRAQLLLVMNILLLAMLLALTVFASNMAGADIRFEKWAFSLDIFGQQPEYVLMGMPVDRPLEHLGIYFSDNMFLFLLFRTGAVGFIAFCCYYVTLLLLAIRHLAGEHTTMRPLAGFLLCATILFFYSNCLSFYPAVLIHGVAAGALLARSYPAACTAPNHIKATQ